MPIARQRNYRLGDDTESRLTRLQKRIAARLGLPVSEAQIIRFAAKALEREEDALDKVKKSGKVS